MVAMSSEVSQTPDALVERELVRKMRERLVRCAALSALCSRLREQVAERARQNHGTGRAD